MTIKMALLGLGHMGRNHLRILSMLRSVEICNIFDVDKASLKKLSKEYSVPYTLNIEEALTGVDAVVIATPTSTHHEYFKLCVGRIKNIFIEKPLAASYEQALEMKSLAEKYGVFVQCGFIERFNPVI